MVSLFLLLINLSFSNQDCVMGSRYLVQGISQCVSKDNKAIEELSLEPDFTLDIVFKDLSPGLLYQRSTNNEILLQISITELNQLQISSKIIQLTIPLTPPLQTTLHFSQESLHITTSLKTYSYPLGFPYEEQSPISIYVSSNLQTVSLSFHHTRNLQCTGDCLQCSAIPNQCTKCTDINSYPNYTGYGCLCNDSYYDTITTDSIVTCSKCHPHCETCTVYDVCDSCFDSVAIPLTSGGCYCPDGQYDADPDSISFDCQACHPHCSRCAEANKCEFCHESIAIPNNTLGCNCPSGYYDQLTDDTALTCEICDVGCEECTSETFCTVCADENAKPNRLGVCECVDGYYDTNDDEFRANCVRCQADCKVCEEANVCIVCFVKTFEPDPNIGCRCPARSTQSSVNGLCECDYPYVNKGTSSIIQCLEPDEGMCDQGEYYDGSICAVCNPLCTACLIRPNQCLGCIENAVLSSSNTCDCDFGYVFSNDKCILEEQASSEGSQDERVQDFELDSLGNFVALITVMLIIIFSIKSQEFSVCWLGIHTFQVLRFVPLINVIMHDQFAGFMRGCEFYNPIPNLFSLFYDKDEEFLFDRAIVYGLETNLWLELGGFWLMALLVVTILIPVFILMSKAKSEKLADFGKKCSGYYRYNAPIRLLLLAYLEITIAALLQMLGFNQSSAIQIFGIACGFAALLISIAGTPIVFKGIFSEITEFYSTLIAEFKNKLLRDKFYYLLFIIRRGIYAVILVFLESQPIYQITLLIISQSILIIYLAIVSPLKTRRLQIAHNSVEGGLLYIFCIVGIMEATDDDGTISFFGYTGIICVFAISAILIANSIMDMIKRSKDIKFEQENKNQTKVFIMPAQGDIGDQNKPMWSTIHKPSKESQFLSQKQNPFQKTSRELNTEIATFNQDNGDITNTALKDTPQGPTARAGQMYDFDERVSQEMSIKPSFEQHSKQ